MIDPTPFPRLCGLAASLLLAFAAPPAFAAPAKKPVLAKGDVTRAQLMVEVRQVFNRADTNKDNFMDRAEFRTRMGAVLNRTPPGSAGAPSRAEAQRLLDAADRAFTAVDSNHDNKLSRVEASKRPLAAFDMMDGNKDGVLTVAEKIAARQRDPARPSAGGGGGRR